MADSGAWDAGWNLGSNLAAHRTARKEELSDYELQGKAQMYATELTNLQQKISSLPKDSPEYKQTFSAMQDTLKNVRELFHPNQNPSAVAKFGHLITDALKITSPQQRQATQDQKQAVASAGDARQAQGLVAAAPLSPEQQYSAQVNAQFAAIDKSDLPDDVKERAKESVLKVYQKPVYKGFDVPGVGYREFDTNDPNSIPDGAVPHVNPTVGSEIIAEYKAAKEAGYTGTIMQFRADSTKSKAIEAQAIRAKYGKDLDQLSPEEATAAIAWYRAQNTPTTTSTGQTLVYDQNNQPHIFTHTSTSSKSFPGENSGNPAVNPTAPTTPATSGTSNISQTMAVPNPKGLIEAGNIPIWNRPKVQNADGSYSSEYSTSFEQDGNEVLVPTVVNGKFLTPDGKKPAPGSPQEKAMFQAAWQHYLQTGENLGKFDNVADANAYAQALHNRGNALAPHEVKKKADALKPKTTSAPKSPIGPPIEGFQKLTPDITAANKKYQDAVGLVDFADRVLKNPNNAQEQRDFAQNLERVMSGRFQMAAYDQEVKNAGIANTFEQWRNNITTGALPTEIVSHLVQTAHDYKDAMAAEVAAAKGTGGSSSDNVANKQKFPGAPDIGTIESGDDGNLKYIGGDPAQQSSWQLVTQ